MVEVVVPWRGGCPFRARALKFVLGRLRSDHPAWLVTVAEAPPGPWVKAAAVMPAIAASTADLIVVADADIWTPGLTDAVRSVEERGAPWAIPHRTVYRLTEEASRRVIDGATNIWPGLPTAERPYTGVEGGGAVVLPRELALDVPLDGRFTGWGQEDVSWALALRSLAGAPRREPFPLFHLWHPPQPRMTRRHGSPEGRTLFRRYAAAASAGVMRPLIEEAKSCRSLTS